MLEVLNTFVASASDNFDRKLDEMGILLGILMG